MTERTVQQLSEETGTLILMNRHPLGRSGRGVVADLEAPTLHPIDADEVEDVYASWTVWGLADNIRRVYNLLACIEKFDEEKAITNTVLFNEPLPELFPEK
jgi:hypothetical protein